MARVQGPALTEAEGEEVKSRIVLMTGDIPVILIENPRPSTYGPGNMCRGVSLLTGEPVDVYIDGATILGTFAQLIASGETVQRWMQR